MKTKTDKQKKANPTPNALPVAICAVVDKGRLLMIERTGNFAGKVAMPGGKIKIHEHASDAVVREILEETGYTIKNPKFVALISEIYDSSVGRQHFLMHIFRGTLVKGDPVPAEFTPIWMPISDVSKWKHRLVASDFAMITKILTKRVTGYWDCHIEEIGKDKYHVTKFTKR